MPTAFANGDVWLQRVFCWDPANRQLGINDYLWEVTALTGTITDTIAIVDLDGAFDVAYKAVLCVADMYLGSTLYRWTTPRTKPIAYKANAGPGTNVSPNKMPCQVASVISRQTSKAGRGGYGRVFVPFPNTAMVNPDSSMTAAATVLYNAIATAASSAYLIGSGGNTCTLVPVLTPRSPLLPSTVFDAGCTGQWGTQRRRGDYGRTNAIPTILL